MPYAPRNLHSIINLALKRGQQLAETFGDKIVRDYRNGLTQEVLAKKYSSDWETSRGLAESSVAKALELLLDLEERKKLAKEHNRLGSIRRNQSWPKELMIQRTRNRGQDSYLGDFRKTEMGLVEEETYYVSLVSKEKSMNKHSGKRKKINWKIIARKTNKIFGKNRDARKLATHYHNIILKRQKTRLS